MNANAVPAPVASLPFRQLLYRYWFFGWLFKDVNRPTLLERAAAWRHNQEQARWLPLYLRRWACVTLLSFAVGALLEHGLGAPGVSAMLYVQAILGVTFNAVTAALLLGFKFLPGPF